MAGNPFKTAIEIGGLVGASLGQAINQAQRQIGGLAQNTMRSMNASAAATKRSFKDVFNSASWQQAAIGATAVAGALVLAVKAAAEFDQSMADVRKAIDFKDGIAGAQKFGEQLIQLSTEIPYSAKELSAIAAAAGFAGYKQPEILPFVRAAAQMGVAFTISADQAGDMMIGLRAGMALSQAEVVKLADSINYLSDQFEGTVTAADLGEVTRRIGAVGIASGLAADQVAGLGAAFLASGTPVEIAATGLKNFLKAMTAGQASTKKQMSALVDIFGSGQREALQAQIAGQGDALAAQVAGMTGQKGKGAAAFRKNLRGQAKELKAQAKLLKAQIKGLGGDLAVELAKQMQVDPEGAIRRVLEGISKLPAWQQPGIASQLFGEESKAAIMPLIKNVKLLEQAFGLIKNPEVSGSMMREFDNQMKTTTSQFKMFRNQLAAIGISVGLVLLPALNSIMKALAPVLRGAAKWAQQHKELTLGIVLVTGALAGLVIALPILAAVAAGFSVISLPVVAVGAAIIGVVAAFKALYDKVPIFKKIVDTTFTVAKQFIERFFTAIRGFARAWGDVFRGMMNFIVGFFEGDTKKMAAAWDYICRGFSDAGDVWMKYMGDVVIDGVKLTFTAFTDWLGSVFIKKMEDAGMKAGDGFGKNLVKGLAAGTKQAFDMTPAGLVLRMIRGPGASPGGAGEGGGFGEGGGGLGGGAYTLQGVKGLPGYDPGHSGNNQHVHHRASSPAEAKAVAAALQRAGMPITEFKGWNQRVGSHKDPGHYDGRAMDIPIGNERHGEALGIIKSATDTFRKGAGRAFGGSVIRGAQYVVGERGAEVFKPSQSGQVLPDLTALTKSQGGRSKREIALNVGGITVNAGGNSDTPSITRAIQDALNQLKADLQSSHRLLLND